MVSVTSLKLRIFLVDFCNFFYSVFCCCLFLVFEKNISIHLHNYIIDFSDRSGGELFTLNSCRRDNMEKRETRAHARTHARTDTHTHSETG